MSSSQQKAPKSTKSHSRESISNIIHDLNAQIDRLGESVLPRLPYLLSVPSDVPYRHSLRFVNTWHLGTPFDRPEEQLQYMSFLPHQTQHEQLLRVEGGWWDEQRQVLENEPSPRTTYVSGRPTPVDSTQRKKISLKDYKSKDKVPSPREKSTELATVIEAKQEGAMAPPEEERKLEPEEKGDAGTAVSAAQTQEAPVLTRAESRDPPPFDGASSPRSPPAFKEEVDSPRPVKRRKLSPSPMSDVKLATDEDSKPLPQLLSPTLTSPKRETTLPELLSPLLPPTLVKAITTPPPSSGHERTNSHHRSESVRSILANAIGESSPRLGERNGDASGSLGANRVRSDSHLSARSNGSATTTNKPLAHVKSTALASKPGTPPHSASRSPGPRQRHIIALKYGKKNRKRVEALLKFAARPKKVAAKPEVDEASAKAAPTQGPLVKESPKAKSGMDHSLEPSAKSKVLHSPLQQSKRPTTPTLSKAREPTSPTMTKSSYNTPMKEFKSTAMRRVESTDGIDPATPDDRGRGSTPLGGERVSAPKTSPAPSSTPSVKDEDRQSWTKVSQKHFQLGRTIKHEGQALAEKDSSKSVALLIEALLCFMINLATQSSARPNVDPGWRTILGYHIFVFRASRPFPLLHGLVVQLGGICRQLIHKHDMDRLGRDPLPDDHLGSAPTPGSDGNTKTTEDGEKYKKKYLDFRDELVQNARELQIAWLEGSRRLSIDHLQREFPETWARRMKDSLLRGIEKPSPNRMATGYHLPLDPASTAFEAAQYGLAVLGEWANNEEVDWRPRIEL